MHFDLSDEERAVIGPLLPKGGRGPKRVDDRRILNGIFYILPSGAPSSNLRREQQRGRSRMPIRMLSWRIAATNAY